MGLYVRLAELSGGFFNLAPIPIDIVGIPDNRGGQVPDYPALCFDLGTMVHSPFGRLMLKSSSVLKDRHIVISSIATDPQRLTFCFRYDTAPSSLSVFAACN